MIERIYQKMTVTTIELVSGATETEQCSETMLEALGFVPRRDSDSAPWRQERLERFRVFEQEYRPLLGDRRFDMLVRHFMRRESFLPRHSLECAGLREWPGADARAN